MSRKRKRVVDCTGTETACKMHGTKMEKETIPVVYGDPFSSLTICRARDSLFPNGLPCVFGGCVVRDSSPTHARVRYCPDCRKAFQVWRADHPEVTNSALGMELK